MKSLIVQIWSSTSALRSKFIDKLEEYEPAPKGGIALKLDMNYPFITNYLA